MKSFYCLSICLLIFLQSWSSTNSNLDDSIKYLNNTAAELLFKGDFEASEKLFLKTLEVAISGYSPDHPEVADVYNNIGVVLLYRWQYTAALDYLNKAMAIYEANEDKINAANVYSNIGNIYRHKGDFQNATIFYNRTLDYLAGEQTAIAVQRRMELYNRYALIEIERQNYQKAISLLARAYNENTTKKGTIEGTILNTVLINLGVAYSLANELDSSQYFFQLSLNTINEKNTYTDVQKASTFQELADHYLRQHKLKSTIATLDSAEKYFTTSSIGSLFYLKRLTQYAEYYYLKKDYSHALSFYNQAYNVTKNKDSSEIKNLFASNIKGISILKNRAKALIEWYKEDGDLIHLKLAFNDLQTATKLIDYSRSSYLSIESKLFIANNQSVVFDMGLQCSHSLYKKTNKKQYLESAFYFSEKGKSSVLLDAINEEKAKSFSGIPNDLLEQEKELKREISFHKEMLYQEGLKTAPDSVKMKKLNTNLFSYSTDYESLMKTLEKHYPEYYEFKYSNTSTSIQSIQEQLLKNETLIEFSITEKSIYTFIINKDNTLFYKRHLCDTFNTVIEDYLNHYKTFDFNKQGKNIFSQYENSANRVYNMVFSSIPKQSLKENLIIVPDGIISYIPFEGLACTLNPESLSSFSDIDYLLFHHPISYSYSATLYTETNQKRRRKLLNRVLAVAPKYSYNPEEAISQNRTSEYSLRDKLIPLPYAQDEVKMITDITHGRMSLGEEATVPYFINESKKYDILHLAMHTLIDDKNPLYSRLVFYDDNYSDENGLLNTNEIFSLNLNAKLTVLSACSSGDGEYSKGEGVMSLSRGFFYAGCPSLVMTLWKVEDESALKLMKFFYTSLIKGKSKSEALNTAKIKYLNSSTEQSKHPFFWASYILIGNTSPIYISKAVTLIAISIIVIIMLIVYLRLKRKQKLPEPNPTSNRDHF